MLGVSMSSNESDLENKAYAVSNTQSNTPAHRKSRPKKNSKNEWEVIGGLRVGERFTDTPLKFDGYLHKKRNPPLKGWHKRYFVLEEGFLSYSKTPHEHLKRRYHGRLDVGLSFLSFNSRKKKIDIDTEDVVCHIRTSNVGWFEEWVENLKRHRLYRQTQLAYTKDSRAELLYDNKDDETPADPQSDIGSDKLPRVRDGSFKHSVPQQGKVVAWLLDHDSSSQYDKDLQQVCSKLDELAALQERVELLPLTFSNHSDCLNGNLTPDSHKSRGSAAKMLSFKHSSKKERKLLDTANSKSSSSNPALVKFAIGDPERVDRPSSPSPSLSSYHNRDSLSELKACDEFISNSHQVHTLLKNLAHRIGAEQERLRKLVEDDYQHPAYDSYVNSLKVALQESLHQNQELKEKLEKIHQLSVFSAMNPISVPSSPVLENNKGVPIRLPANLGRVKSVSLDSKASEAFYDATEYVRGDGATSASSSDSSSSEFSDREQDTAASEEMIIDDRAQDIADNYETGRRSKLPSPMTAADLSVLSLLTRNIGKDLTRISMPVTLNEPLNTLQLLCEGLEYSDLLDKAATSSDPYERMACVAAFAVSGYSSTVTRASTKPFNPLLGETYECIRPDKGWKFIAEQVSHHPPISACHAESRNFVYTQDVRIRTKFWGKSMEFHPSGHVSVQLPKYNEEYTWNKITTCVHNILAGQRWVDQYGDMIIKCNNIICKLTFVKASYWSDKKHEVHGTIRADSGEVVLYLFGKWTEGLYCGDREKQSSRCIWRPGSLPDDHHLYYGFTRFAVELNELHPGDIPMLPRTDTRFRPDQRLLEEGRVHEAEQEKQRVEKLQREARKQRDDLHYIPRWFRKDTQAGEEGGWKFTDEYWKLRHDPGFARLELPVLW